MDNRKNPEKGETEKFRHDHRWSEPNVGHYKQWKLFHKYEAGREQLEDVFHTQLLPWCLNLWLGKS